MKKQLTVSGNSEGYANEREEFMSWMNETYPEVELIENGQGYYEDGESSRMTTLTPAVVPHS